MNMPIRNLLTSTILMMALLIRPMTGVYAGDQVKWKPIVSELDIVTIDEEGVEYVIAYIATKGLFDDFLPVAEEMVKSFSVTGDILSTGEESAEGANDSPNLPPIKESPTFQKL